MDDPRYESNRPRKRLAFVRSTRCRDEEVELRTVLYNPFRRASDDSNNRAAVAGSSRAAAFDQRTRCRRSGTSESQVLAFHKREGYSDKVQTSQKSYCRAPLVIERRRTRIPAGALDAGGDPTHDCSSLNILVFSFLRVRRPTHSENQLIDAVRFREYDDEAELFADGFDVEAFLKVGTCTRDPHLNIALDESWRKLSKSTNDAFERRCNLITDFSRDLPQHLNEEVKALTSQFDDLLHNRRLREGRAARGNSLGKLQQHGATLTNMEPPSYWRRPFLRLSYLRALAHFESTLQSLTDGKDRKILVESIPQNLEEKIRPWIVGLEGNQIINLFTRDHQPFFTMNGMVVSDMNGSSRPDRQWIYPPVPCGTMVSGNQVVKSIVTTDYWRDVEGTVYFKVEHAGLNCFLSMVIQGIRVDVDSHQRPRWRLRIERLRFVFWWEDGSTSRYSCRPTHLAPSLLT